MALILAMDTSTLVLSLALAERDGSDLRLIEQVGEGPPKRQSEMLPGVIEELLHRHGLSTGDMDALVIGLGPGSFTGLRIGLATFKGIAYAHRIPLVGASSLAALALEGPEEWLQMPCALARKGDLYFGQYRRTGNQVATVAPEDAESTAEFAARLKRSPGAVALGPGLESEAEVLRAQGVPNAQLVTELNKPSALALMRLVELPKEFDEQTLFALEPHYVRASEPERNPRFPPLPGPPPTARLKGE